MSFLSRDTHIQGHLCRGGADAWETGFYPNGRLRLCWLADDEELGGVACRRATIWADVTGGSVGLWLWENGRLRQCEAAARFRVGGRAAKKGDTVRVDRRGVVTVNGHCTGALILP